jgi:hypothetical protein
MQLLLASTPFPITAAIIVGLVLPPLIALITVIYRVRESGDLKEYLIAFLTGLSPHLLLAGTLLAGLLRESTGFSLDIPDERLIIGIVGPLYSTILLYATSRLILHRQDRTTIIAYSLIFLNLPAFLLTGGLWYTQGDYAATPPASSIALDDLTCTSDTVTFQFQHRYATVRSTVTATINSTSTSHHQNILLGSPVPTTDNPTHHEIKLDTPLRSNTSHTVTLQLHAYSNLTLRRDCTTPTG